MAGSPLQPADLRELVGVDLSRQQLQAATAPLEPAVVVAGAGTGKTTVMAARVVWLVATGQVAPEAVLGLTFTTKAAAELEQRIRAALLGAGLLGTVGLERSAAPDRAEEPAEPTVLTYHAYAARLLAEHGVRIGHEPDTRLLVDASRFRIAERVAATAAGPFTGLSTHLPTVVRYLLELDAQLSEHLVTADAARAFSLARAAEWDRPGATSSVRDAAAAQRERVELLDLVDGYRAAKRRLGVMDFSDQMALAATLAESSTEVRAVERSRFGVVLLDEYQDTSVAQTRLLRALFSGPDPASGAGHPVTAVGDPCQAIYGWRGASVGNIERFPVDFPCSDAGGRREAPRLPLSTSRRAGGHLLDAANRVAAELYETYKGVEPLAPQDGAGPGLVRAALVTTSADELAFLAAEVPRAHDALPGRRWSDIAVLVRDNATAADVHGALAAAGVPVEVVGLSGLLGMPAVREVVATLEVLESPTANAAILHLLAGPRWAIGVRDLDRLGRRAGRLARAAYADGSPPTESTPAGEGDVEPPDRESVLRDQLARAVGKVDPVDVGSLSEAVESPGRPDHYSAEALQRFAALAGELRELRQHVGEPLLDLVHRVIETTGVDVELASSLAPEAAVRRDNLATFVDAVATFAGLEAEANLAGLIAYLEAEDDYGRGLQLAIPSASDSVKLLTVHRAKGLEWDVVFVPGMCCRVFPSEKPRDRWPTFASQLPWPLRGDAADQPALPSPLDQKALKAFVKDCQEHDRREERRLGYVALTRARHELVVSAHWWGPTQIKSRGPSCLFDEVVESMRARGEAPELNAPKPADGEANPQLLRAAEPRPWPVEAREAETTARRAAADLVETAIDAGWQDAATQAASGLSSAEADRVAGWDLELDRLIAEATAAAGDVVVPLPAALSATALLRLAEDPERFARDLARPMPRKPSRAARFGTRFHARVEALFGQQQLIGLDDLPDRADEAIADEAELEELLRAFAAGPYGDRPPYRVEAPFSLVLAGQVVPGRIDAVYRSDDGYEVVDWKTNRAATADPLQLAIYRVAWAQLAGVPVDQVAAAFYYVRTGEVVRYPDLPSRAELEQIVSKSLAGELPPLDPHG